MPQNCTDDGVQNRFANPAQWREECRDKESHIYVYMYIYSPLHQSGTCSLYLSGLWTRSDRRTTLFRCSQHDFAVACIFFFFLFTRMETRALYPFACLMNARSNLIPPIDFFFCMRVYKKSIKRNFEYKFIKWVMWKYGNAHWNSFAVDIIFIYSFHIFIPHLREYVSIIGNCI